MSVRYRPEIDGLRALAVLPVVLFHAHIAGFAGGYVGVDVFFVISGFLITSILVKDLERGSYSVWDFYERRIRRIAPALLVVIAFVLAIAPFSLLPSEFSRLGPEALGAMLFVANIVFWRDSGYFSADAESRPLLHTWSLGIEEQFYIVAPIVLALVIARARRHLPRVIPGMALASFVACVVLTPVSPGTSFYLLPTRAWELLAGACLAVYVHERSESAPWPRWVREAVAAAGALLIIVPVLSYSPAISFPGYAALAPVLGAVLVILCAADTLVGRALSHRGLVAIGLVSYSLYLWHWPLTVFARNIGLLDSPWGRCAVVLVSILVAWLSWKFIEQPTRDRRRFPARRLVPLVLGGAALLAAVSLVYIGLDGWPHRLDAKVVLLDDARHDISPARGRCHIGRGTRSPEQFCTLGSGQARVALWADSHGVELAQALSEQGIPVVSITYSACRPSLAALNTASRRDCDDHNAAVREYLTGSTGLDTVVLVANYSGSQERLAGLVAVADRLRAAGKRVVLVGPTPTLPGRRDLPTYLARGGPARTSFNDLPADAFIRQASGHELVLPEKIFCRDGDCDLLWQGAPLLFDGHHPSMSASRATAAALADCIRSAPCTWPATAPRSAPAGQRSHPRIEDPHDS